MSNSDYRAFMLRMQRVGDRNRPKWRFTLQDAVTHKQVALQSLGALMLFIEQQTIGQDDLDHTNETTNTPRGSKLEM